VANIIREGGDMRVARKMARSLAAEQDRLKRGQKCLWDTSIKWVAIVNVTAK